MTSHSIYNCKWLVLLTALTLSACKSTETATKTKEPEVNEVKSNPVNQAIINYCMEKSTESKSLTFLACYSEILRQLVDKVYEDESFRSNN